MKTLAIGRSTLEVLRKQNAVYVDKTEIIHRLLTSGGGVYFFSRPRRFGKSLLVDTLKQIFLGNKTVFEGTWIAQEGRHAWKARPVIHLDFSGLDCTDATSLQNDLLQVLSEIGETYGITITKESIPSTLRSLISQLASQDKVAILIDEYDTPIIRNILNKKAGEGSREILRLFYTTLKSLDAYLHFVFLTGVSKFSKTSLFSGMNNLEDISFSGKYATLCGYTQEELEKYFDDHLNATALHRKKKLAELLDDLRFWYNGYRFSSAPVRVYNPFSVLMFLSQQRFDNFWASTGTPQFLIDIIQDKFHDFESFERASFTQDAFGAFEIDSIPLMPIFYQAGYITIKDYFPDSEEYTFTYPNEEVRRSFSAALIGSIMSQDIPTMSGIFTQLRQSINSGNTESFCNNLKALLASIPYSIHIKREAYYHSILHTIGLAIGGVLSEAATSNGRIDLVLQSNRHLFIIELKINSSTEAALAQIKDRRYYEPFMQQGKIIHLVGLNFNFETKLLTHAHETISTYNLTAVKTNP